MIIESLWLTLRLRPANQESTSVDLPHTGHNQQSVTNETSSDLPIVPFNTVRAVVPPASVPVCNEKDGQPTAEQSDSEVHHLVLDEDLQFAYKFILKEQKKDKSGKCPLKKLRPALTCHLNSEKRIGDIKVIINSLDGYTVDDNKITKTGGDVVKKDGTFYEIVSAGILPTSGHQIPEPDVRRYQLRGQTSESLPKTLAVPKASNSNNSRDQQSKHRRHAPLPRDSYALPFFETLPSGSKPKSPGDPLLSRGDSRSSSRLDSDQLSSLRNQLGEVLSASLAKSLAVPKARNSKNFRGQQAKYVHCAPLLSDSAALSFSETVPRGLRSRPGPHSPLPRDSAALSFAETLPRSKLNNLGDPLHSVGESHSSSRYQLRERISASLPKSLAVPKACNSNISRGHQSQPGRRSPLPKDSVGLPFAETLPRSKLKHLGDPLLSVGEYSDQPSSSRSEPKIPGDPLHRPEESPSPSSSSELSEDSWRRKWVNRLNSSLDLAENGNAIILKGVGNWDYEMVLKGIQMYDTGAAGVRSVLVELINSRSST